MCAGEDVVAPNIDGTLAHCSANYGFGIINPANRTHLHWQWHETGPATLPFGLNSRPFRTNQTEVDSVWLVKDA
jgi:hypothetical protein